MISKERLKELIEKGVEIYSIYESPFDKPCVSYIELDGDWFFEIENGNLEIRGYDIVGDEFLTDHSLDKLFETKAEAEHHAKYCGIPSDEVLNLPTWEKYCEKPFITIFIKDLIVMLDSFDNAVELSIKQYDAKNRGHRYIKTFYYAGLTKENYYKALDLCVSIWKGEK